MKKTLLDEFIEGIDSRLNKKYTAKERADIVARLREKWKDNITFADPVALAKAMLISVDDDDFVNFDDETGLIVQEGNLLPADNIAFATILRRKELFAREESIILLTEFYEKSQGLQDDPWPDIEEDSINERGEYGRTPVHNAVKSDDYDTVCSLVDNGADLNISDNNGHTPSQFALVLGGRGDIYAYLIEIERRQK